MFRIAAVPLAALLLVACQTTSAVSGMVRSYNMSESDAESVLRQFESHLAAKPATLHPLANPKSLDDVLEVLRTDDVDLFPAAVQVASADGTPAGKALHAQLELAWGEALLMLSEFVERTMGNLRNELRGLKAKELAGTLKGDDVARLEKLKKTIVDLEGAIESASALGGLHLERGGELARKFIAEQPGDYHGYRLAADYHRTQKDWAAFDGMIKKVEEAKPDSTGLLFLRGVEAAQRGNDPAKAVGFFQQALAKDPKFARAQAQIVLAQVYNDKAYAELQKLKELSPEHQMVSWGEPVMKLAAEQAKNAARWIHIYDRDTDPFYFHDDPRARGF